MGQKMANEVYSRALSGVQRLVSARAASRALGNALKARGETPDTVDAEVMSRVLLGPILSEFEMILPREGLKRQLRSLAASLRKNFPKPAEAGIDRVPEPAAADVVSAEDVHEDTYEGAAAAPSEGTDPGFVYQTNALSEVPESLDLVFSVTASSVRMPQPPQLEVERTEPVQSVPNAVSAPEVLEPEESFELPAELLEHVPEADAGPDQPEPSAPASVLSQEALGDAVLLLAQLEQVKFVAALRSNGEVAAQRGSGVDIGALAQLGLVGLKLLRRSGPLRTFYLAHTQGQLFLLPLGDDTLTLVGTPELNVGAVFNALATLKEER